MIKVGNGFLHDHDPLNMPDRKMPSVLQERSSAASPLLAILAKSLREAALVIESLSMSLLTPCAPRRDGSLITVWQ